MASLSSRSASLLLTDLARLPQLLAYTQSLDLGRHLHRPKRGIPTLALALLWLCLAWRGSGRPYHLNHYEEPLLAALIGRHRLPCDQTLYRSLAYFSAKALRSAVEEAYLHSRSLLQGTGRSIPTRCRTGDGASWVDSRRAGAGATAGGSAAIACSWPLIPRPAR